MSVLLTTKLHQPASLTKSVERPQLIHRLNTGLESGHQIFLVSAPAGFGKTTCINEWLHTLEMPLAWLSLDSADDDPGRFFTYLLAALQKVNEHIGHEVDGVLRTGQLPPAEIISATLIKDVLNFNTKFLLVLDDFHVVQDHFIFEFLEKLVANLPELLHLVLITREDPPLPLAQLRASNHLTEIRAKDLCFTHDDIDIFMRGVMGLSLSQADLAILEDKTEGWVVGLQLACLSIRDQEDPSNFIATLSGSHRHILGYLTEQVLSQQPEDIRDFLLQTSILDKLNGDLCNAVTGRSDSYILLERLFDANLFLIPLDDEGRWYRYHHLFADLLRNIRKTRQEVQTAGLHQRSSRWYAQAGMASEAIQHALAAEDYALAVDLLESHAMGMIMQGFIKTVNGWVQAIPDEWALRSPRTNLAFAWAYCLHGDYIQAVPHLERLQAIMEEYPLEFGPGNEEALLKAEWLAMQSLMLYKQGKALESKSLAARALEALPAQDHRMRSLAYYALASAHWLMEDYPGATEAYRLSIEYGRAETNPMAEMMSTVALAGMAIEHGQLHLAFEIAFQAVERVERSEMLPPISAVVYAALGDVCYQWNRIEEARRYFQRALHLGILGGLSTIAIFCRMFLARQEQLEGNLEAAASEIQSAIELIPVDAPEYVRQEVAARQVRIHLARNRPAAAELALQGQGISLGIQFSFSGLPPGESISYSPGVLYNSSLHFLLHQARTANDQSRLRSGIEMADRLITRAFKGQQHVVALEALLLRAQMYTALGDNLASQKDYVKALELAEPEGFIAVFIEHGQPVANALRELVKQNRPGTIRAGYIERILQAFSGTDHPLDEQPASVSSAGMRSTDLIEPLTDREVDVLHLIVEGLKYKEIAARLFITQNTVRFHVKSIYGKLNVNSRTQAIAAARQLRIL